MIPQAAFEIVVRELAAALAAELIPAIRREFAELRVADVPDGRGVGGLFRPGSSPGWLTGVRRQLSAWAANC